MPRAIFFDLDDTLHDDRLSFVSAAREVAADVAYRRDVGAESLAQAFVEELERFWQRFDAAALQPGTNVRELMWSEALRRFELDDISLAAECAHAFEAKRIRYYRLFPGTLETLHILRSRGYRLALLTNGLTATHREKIRILDLERHVDGIYLSDEMGVSKPDVRAFEHACGEMGSRPDESIMVGDRYDKDIAGAKHAGLATIWLNIRNEATDDAPLADAIITHIDEVPIVIERLLPLSG